MMAIAMAMADTMDIRETWLSVRGKDTITRSGLADASPEEKQHLLPMIAVMA